MINATVVMKLESMSKLRGPPHGPWRSSKSIGAALTIVPVEIEPMTKGTRPFG